ncbi:mitotic checkpoint serine/threonine-protein kinase BUB1 beta-like [Paramacrobiotus metropolitanus]|uniref:mitotic checkpoint serine/threonine-protein kinase BUB1 beta-like n=1 Tax=Paramacrobiotus metropolitanus TaxID=2943436 RepID=UPI002445D107|nr:mitotic checkpoint serine/threonine-protein kinase BUB1 beta-like [Paramacrobiotus metropolitanus]
MLMKAVMAASEDWDTSKENIRPLRQGRQVSSLADVSETKTLELNAKRQEFEQRIAEPAGDDPLAEWDAYIQWVESNYPRGGKESGYNELLTRCCQHFLQCDQESKRYFQDERFVKIWIKFATKDPKLVLESFSFMEKQQIGTLSPVFYLAWASELESVRATLKAEEILDKGITACAGCPDHVLRLQAGKKALLDRDARALVLDPEAFSVFDDELEEERTALGALQAVGKDKGDAPVNRIGDSKLRKFYPTVVSVFNDAGDKSDRPHAPEEPVFPSTSQERENTIAVTKFEKSRNKHAVKIVPARVDNPFEIHRDPPEKSAKESRRPITDHRGLKSRDSVKEEQPLESILNTPVAPSNGLVCSVDWSVLNYKDPGAKKREPAVDRLPCSSNIPYEPAPPAPNGQVFAWNYSLFQESQELSIEEALCISYRRTRQSQQQKEDADKILAEKLAAAKLELAAAENQRQIAEYERRNVLVELAEKQKVLDERLISLQQERGALDHLQQDVHHKIALLHEKNAVLEQKLQEAGEKLVEIDQLKLEAEEQYRLASDVHKSNEEDLFVTESIANGLSSCLTALHKDINRNDMDAWDCMFNFAYDLQRRLERITESQHHSATAWVNMMHEVAGRILSAIQQRQLPEEMQNGISEDQTGMRNDYFAGNENPEQSDNIVLSQGPYQSSQPLSGRQSWSEHPVNPAINAMWNQTLNGTSRERSAASGLLDTDDENAGRAFGDNRSPMRHSFVVKRERRSFDMGGETCEMFSIYEDSPEARPSDNHSSPMGFEIFQDEVADIPAAVCIPDADERLLCSDTVEELGNRQVEISTPPEKLDDNQKGSEAVLELSGQDTGSSKDDDYNKKSPENWIFVKVEHDAAIEMDSPQDVCKPDPITARKSLNPGFADEFSSTRKSLAYFDQTIQLESESQFFDHIDFEKCMASTPKTRLKDPEASGISGQSPDDYRRRQSYYPLSPILEGSRENKTSSSSNASSTISMHLRSKKSTGNYEAVDEAEERSVSVDPYCASFMESFKERLRVRVETDPLVIMLDAELPEIVSGRTVLRLDGKYIVEEKLGEGSYAAVYRVRCRSDASNTWALKVQPKSGWWDQYIHSEILRRLNASADYQKSLPYIINAQQFFRLKDDGTYNLLPLFEHDTILKLVKAFQNSPEKSVPEPLCMKLTLDVLRAVESLHSIGIIHGDIKADNFLIQGLKEMSLAESAEEFVAIPSAVLTDFGCGIDTTLFETGTTFSTMRKGKTTAGFEILQGRPWTYEIDLYGVLDVIHTMLFGEYMKVYEEGGIWKITKSFKRSYSEIWSQTFHKLLNTASADQLPNLCEIRKEFEETTVRRVQMMNVGKLSRQIRVTFFMQRKSCVLAR